MDTYKKEMEWLKASTEQIKKAREELAESGALRMPPTRRHQMNLYACVCHLQEVTQALHHNKNKYLDPHGALDEAMHEVSDAIKSISEVIAKDAAGKCGCDSCGDEEQTL
jgi:hypothetical protein